MRVKKQEQKKKRMMKTQQMKKNKQTKNKDDVESGDEGGAGCFRGVHGVGVLGQRRGKGSSSSHPEFIFAETHCPTPPPFNIPRVHFVDAGLAFSYSQRDSKPTRAGSKTGLTCAGYLVEELIEGGSDTFLKFIHNMDSNPLLDEDDYCYKVALFFAFTQHVQYVKMGGLAFILDYQDILIGSTELLTDPQILTDPSVGEGTDLFGKGNMECTVSMFEKQHKCNEFCEWPGFGLVPFATMTEDESMEEAEAGCREDALIVS
ncbi:hypothetical protein BDR05DRAFT_1018043 [Suillus weaverae]|nr:hypothetical protein BDR05DRAFT_1018043 [Suillus weaverae]